jgi:DNA-binding transcriptional MocR family regulator
LALAKTIKQLADELKVSKQTIQYHYQRLPAENQQKNSQGTNLISPTAERIIRGKVAKPLLANKQQIGSKEPTKTSKENNDLIITLRREVEDLKSQRDKQLATKDRQIDHLTKLLDQQQQLQLTTVAENRELKKHVQELDNSIKISKPVRKGQTNDKYSNLSKNSDNIKKEVDEINVSKNPVPKNKANEKWWHFW